MGLFILYVLIVLGSFSYVFPFRVGFASSFFLFDIVIFIFVLVAAFTGLLAKKKILRSHVCYVVFWGVLIVVLSCLQLIGDLADIKYNIAFLIQYFFTVVVLPLFVYSVSYFRKWEVFFWCVLTMIAFKLIVFFLGFDLEFLNTRFDGRLTFGEFTPNESGYYFAFLMLAFCYLRRDECFFHWFFFARILFVFTESKTVFLSIIISFFSSRKILLNFIGCIGLLLVGACVFLFTSYSWSDWSFAARSNEIRLDMSLKALEYIPSSIVDPLYHFDANSIKGLSSVHNVFLSIFVNFGFLSGVVFVCLFVYLILYLIRMRYFDLLKVLIIIFICFMLNPLINARVIWLPLYILIFFAFDKSEFSNGGFYGNRRSCVSK